MAAAVLILPHHEAVRVRSAVSFNNSELRGRPGLRHGVEQAWWSLCQRVPQSRGKGAEKNGSLKSRARGQ
jgi:hypothetical protein